MPRSFLDDRGSVSGDVPDGSDPAPPASLAVMVGLYPDLAAMEFEKDAALNFTFIIDRCGKRGVLCSVCGACPRHSGWYHFLWLFGG
jgi:hypothetical protein